RAPHRRGATGAEGGRQEEPRPVGVAQVHGGPEERRRRARREHELPPDGAEHGHERAVHHAAEVRREAEARVGEGREEGAGQETDECDISQMDGAHPCPWAWIPPCDLAGKGFLLSWRSPRESGRSPSAGRTDCGPPTTHSGRPPSPARPACAPPRTHSGRSSTPGGPSGTPFERQHGAGSGGRSPAIRPRRRPNSSRGTATSAIWKTRERPGEITCAPILTTFSRSVVRDHCAISSGSARVRRKLARLYASAWSWRRTALARKVVHDSRVHLTACFPSLIHCSAVPRPLEDG